MWPERLLQVAWNIRGMLDDSGTAAFYQLAQLCEIHNLKDLERYDSQYRNVVKYLVRARDGELVLEEGVSGDRRWRWAE